MSRSNQNYARDLDLNLLKVLVAVADTGSVTAAAAQLYVTQPAISAALRRLSTAIGTAVTVRFGRGIVLSARGARLVADIRPHLDAMIQTALAPPRFDPLTSDRTFRLGLSDSTAEWLLPPLLHRLAGTAPRMRFIAIPIQFRTVGEALAQRRIDVAITIADQLSDSIVRRPLFRGRFVCVYDPRFVKLGPRPSERTYFAQEHVIVSYNGDLRGFVEDTYGRERRVRCAVAMFSAVGAIVEGTALVATMPDIVAHQLVARRPRLALARFPLPQTESGMDLLWPSALDADDGCRFLREEIVEISRTLAPHAPAAR
ncbi:MAG TPA: LysR substrate-binding domain-containing protein [Kofleriaceae bacterium]|nr:LysR substrate-binding domain-containing protein [Kofleriaceae bacterium]